MAEKDMVVPVRIPAAEHAKLKDAARRLGLPLSTFLRAGALLAADYMEDARRSRKIKRGLDQLAAEGRKL